MTVCLVILVAFVCELVDTSMGMGFGTAMSAIPLLLGYEAADLVPCILVSELVTGAMASWTHHCLRNADFRAKSRDMRVAGILGLGAAVTVASFNKGISGGGYGPLVMGGQLLSGVDLRNAVAITSFSEVITCLAGLVMYLLFKSQFDWALSGVITVGATLSVPLAARITRRVPERAGKVVAAVLIIALGGATLAKLIRQA